MRCWLSLSHVNFPSWRAAAPQFSSSSTRTAAGAASPRSPQTTFLKNMFPAGHAYVMGPLTGDHWFVFVADWVDRPTELCVDRTLDVSAIAAAVCRDVINMLAQLTTPSHSIVSP